MLKNVGKFVVVRQLGEGSMGTVYLAEHAAYGYCVALKRLHPHLAKYGDLVARFLAEADAPARVHHPGMVDVFESGIDADGTPYLVMDYLEGETLERRMIRRHLGVAESADIGKQIADTLAAAHRAGIVHRDLKPENVFLLRNAVAFNRERVKVLDFGVAKFVGEANTLCGSFFGTPHYMSPEQAVEAAQARAYSDIYALGCVLYQMTTAALPIFGTLECILEAHRSRAPVAPRHINPLLPAAFESLILRMIAKRPEQRPRNMTLVAEELTMLSEAVQREALGHLEIQRAA
jgi:serine/threonine-protein kinase